MRILLLISILCSLMLSIGCGSGSPTGGNGSEATTPEPEPKPKSKIPILTPEEQKDPVKALTTLGWELKGDKSGAIVEARPDVGDNEKTELYQSDQMLKAAMPYLTQLDALQTLSLRYTKTTNDGLAELQKLSGLPKLQTLRLDNWISDDGLKHLKALDQVTTLDLGSEDVTDAGLPHLAEMKNLRTLDINYTKVTHEGLRALKAFPKLTTLGLSSVAVTDKKLRALREIDKLHILEGAVGKDNKRPGSPEEVIKLKFSDAKITTAGLKEVQIFKNLEELNLFRTNIDGSAMPILATFKSLKDLNLASTGIANADFTQLKDLKQLKELNLVLTHLPKKTLAGLGELKSLKLLALPREITKQQKEMLQKQLPDCNIP